VRVLVLAALVAAAAGCGGSGSSSPTDVMSATFSSLAGPNTSGVAISSSYSSCETSVAGGGLTCTASEAANGAGRVVTMSFSGPVAAGMDYQIGGPESATVLFVDPTDFGTASGQRQWQSIPGTGLIRIVDWQSGAHVSFSYSASMRPLASPAVGTFDIVGDGNIHTIVAQ
jgi:hypothetical protein